MDIQPGCSVVSGAAPPPPDLRKGTFQGRTFTVVRAILLTVCRVFLRMRVEGLENVPKTGALIVVGNHLHNADPLLISIAIPRPVHYMAKKELFAVPVIGRIIRLGGAFPVDRGTADRSAIRTADQTLKQGIAVGMFPEGTRSKTHGLKFALPGAAMIAQLTGASIVPVAITGSERLPFNGRTLRPAATGQTPKRRRGVTIVVGQPFSIPTRTEDGRKVDRDEATNRLMTEVARLLPPEYRGIFADHVANESPDERA